MNDASGLPHFLLSLSLSAEKRTLSYFPLETVCLTNLSFLLTQTLFLDTAKRERDLFMSLLNIFSSIFYFLKMFVFVELALYLVGHKAKNLLLVPKSSSAFQICFLQTKKLADSAETSY